MIAYKTYKTKTKMNFKTKCTVLVFSLLSISTRARLYWLENTKTKLKKNGKNAHRRRRRRNLTKALYCTLAVVRRNQKFSPRRRLPSRGRGTAKIKSARDGHYLYLQIQFGEDRCTQFRVIVVTDIQTHQQTGPITIHCAAASARCKYPISDAFRPAHCQLLFSGRLVQG